MAMGDEPMANRLEVTMKQVFQFAVASMSLILAAPLSAQEEHASGPLTVEGGLMFWTIVVFLILLAVLKRFAWPAVLGAVEAREKALEEVRTPKTCDPSIVEEIIKRLGLGNGEFDRLMALPRKSYRDYQTYKRTFERLRWLFWVAAKMELVPRSFYLKFTRKYD